MRCGHTEWRSWDEWVLTGMSGPGARSTQFIADVRAWSGLCIDDQRDPDGRIVSYGYHWHELNEQGVCESWVVYGYPTPLTALSAGLQAKLKTDQRADRRDACEDRLVTRCKIQS